MLHTIHSIRSKLLPLTYKVLHEYDDYDDDDDYNARCWPVCRESRECLELRPDDDYNDCD